MANPRRASYSNPNPIPSLSTATATATTTTNETRYLSLFSSLISFLKRPHAFPFLLSIFLLLTWVSLRLQELHHFNSPQQPHQGSNQKLSKDGLVDGDEMANLVRFASASDRLTRGDKRGWLINPVTAANGAGLSGGALSCASLHVGQIRPGGVRGNHRHHTCNETFVIWGAQTKFRLENPQADKGYAEVTIDVEEVAVASSPSGIAHALVNVDPLRTTFFLGCQDEVITYNTSTDFNVWKDL